MGEPVDLRNDGVLWLINRVVFHPRGFALAIDETGAFSMLGDGTEPWSFTGPDDDLCFIAVEQLLGRARHRRLARVPDQETTDG